MEKDLRKIVKRLEKQGWRVEHGKTHTKLFPPDKTKPIVVVPNTPSDHRSLRNSIAQIRRSGGDV